MRVFAIRDEEDSCARDLAYLFYYEKARCFYIELPDDADEWDTPLILSSFIKKGERTINAYWSRAWVNQRIVPRDRQNIGQILKENDLSDYDEFELLMLANGRCAQDSYYLVPVDEGIPEKMFYSRYEKRIEDVIPLENNALLLFFRDGGVKRCDIAAMRKNDRVFGPILASDELFRRVAVHTGGYGAYWNENAVIADAELYDSGLDVPLSKNDIVRFVSERVISTAEAAELLDCSRQNINDLTARGKLHPVKTEQKNTFYLKSEIMQRLWE